MATKYFALLTNIGAAKLANATALGAKVEITQMAVGDGNGVLPTPNPAQTTLTHELRRAQLNMLTIDPVNTNQIIAEQVIPEDVGGWWIREIGLFDKDGDMIAIANCAETYKPQLQEGSGRVQVIRVILIVSSTEAVTLKIDPSVVLATRKYVDDQIIQVKAYVDQQLAAHIAVVENALAGKQPLDNTLTDLSGKTVDGILTYLGLVTTGKGSDNMLFTGPGGLKIQIFRRSVSNSPNVNGVASTDVTYPQAFPVNVWGVFCTKSSYVQVLASCESHTKTGFRCVTLNVGTATIVSEVVFMAVGY